jgi:hypothetical protein
MPSQLTGLFRTLTWSDFGQPRQGRHPGPGQNAVAAKTAFKPTPFNFQFVHVPGTRPAQFRLTDNLRIAVEFDRSHSFVMNWVFSMSQTDQNDLLHHEQGHYNIFALIHRDFFIDVMLLKLQTFASAQAGIASVQQIRRNSLDKAQRASDLYDADVHQQQNAGIMRGQAQVIWDGLIDLAFQRDRVPPSQSADGRPHKQRLLDVLRAAGKAI